jgi:hypothetical protein
MTTQQVFARYTELYDISTDIGKNIHYKIHTPTGVSHMRKLAGLYKQFKEYKYLGATIAWVPITTLPKDLLGVGYEAGEDTVDPRDLINPILHKGYKGESLITDFLTERALWTENDDATDAGWQGNTYGGTDNRIRRMTESGGVSKIGLGNEQVNYHDILRGMYYTSLTDSEWEKAHPREGFYKELFPLVRTLASTARIGPTGVEQNTTAVPWENNDLPKRVDRDIESLHTAGENTTTKNIDTTRTNIPNTGVNTIGTSVLDTNNFQSINQSDIFTHEFERLGWMETSGKGNLGGTIVRSMTTGETMGRPTYTTDLDLNRMPKVYMYLVQTPPAYKTKQYYRMSITHSFAFRKFRQVYGLDMPNIWSDDRINKPESGVLIDRGHDIIQKIAGKAMYDPSGTYHNDDFEIPPYEPALENTIEADGDGVNITKISDGVF